MYLNKVILIGRLTADPQLRTTNSGNPVTSFSIATNRVWTGSDGQKNEETEFHNIVVWGRQAEVSNQFLSKGSLVMIEGRLQTRSWEGKDGNKRYTTEIVAERIQFGPRSANSSSNNVAEVDKSKNKKDKEEELPEINLDDEDEDFNVDDIPF
ncbi:MAG: single-stranded DNA-binding protein [Candidatus Paceibacterota bacterium]